MNTDGTVTELLRLISGEPISVVKLSEDIDTSTKGKVLFRRVLLQGTETKKNWVFAQSSIFLDNLPKEFVDDLMHKSIPIGSLWSKYRMETFKEMTFQGVDKDPTLKAYYDAETVTFLSRTYIVYSKKKRIMRITEKFPVHYF